MLNVVVMLMENKNNLTKTWNIISDLIHSKNKSRNIASVFHRGKNVTDSLEMANAFNEFFTNIGPNLAEKIPPSNVSFSQFLPQPFNNNSIFLTPSSSSEVFSIIKKLEKKVLLRR